MLKFCSKRQRVLVGSFGLFTLRESKSESIVGSLDVFSLQWPDQSSDTPFAFLFVLSEQTLWACSEAKLRTQNTKRCHCEDYYFETPFISWPFARDTNNQGTSECGIQHANVLVTLLVYSHSAKALSAYGRFLIVITTPNWRRLCCLCPAWEIPLNVFGSQN